eukprot:CFRG4129T1
MFQSTAFLYVMIVGHSLASVSCVPASGQRAIQACECGNGKLKLWGPGGPHTALVQPAELFNNLNQNMTDIEVCWGPENTWREMALECAAGLYSAAQQQMSGFLRIYGDAIDEASVYPITMHISTVVVNKGNPKEITGLQDLFDMSKDIKLVVNDGNYHDTLTSATGLWEDVVGRTFNVDDMIATRKKIIYFASGSGDARDTLLGINDAVEDQADAWITWNDWVVANPDIFESIPISSEYAIARDVSIVGTKNTSESDPDIVQSFVDYLRSDDQNVNEAMQAAGYSKQFIL